MHNTWERQIRKTWLVKSLQAAASAKVQIYRKDNFTSRGSCNVLNYRKADHETFVVCSNRFFHNEGYLERDGASSASE